MSLCQCKNSKIPKIRTTLMNISSLTFILINFHGIEFNGTYLAFPHSVSFKGKNTADLTSADFPFPLIVSGKLWTAFCTVFI